MRNATSPALERLRAGMTNSSAPVSVESITVGGNVEGNIVVGNNNIVYSVHNHYGALVDKGTAPSVRRRKLKQQPPRLPTDFIGRANDVDRLASHIKRKDAVLVYGPDGLGKSTLVRQAANSDAAKAMRDGVVYMQGVDDDGKALGMQDTIQMLFDALYESNPPLKVTPASARTYLNNTQPLVVLNRFEFPSASLNNLADMLTKGALVVTSRSAAGEDSFQRFRLLPLAREESIELLVRKSGIALDDTARAACDRICELLGDVPLAISKTANIIREKGITLTAVLENFQALRPPSAEDPIQAGIERSYGLAYSLLNMEERKALALAAAAPGISVDRPWLESLTGGEKTSKALESLELLEANSPRLRLAEGMRQAILYGRKDLQALRESQLGHLLSELKSRALDFGFMSDELGNILGLLQWASDEQRWSDVITLGRAVDPYLTLRGFWEAWQDVLNQVLVAAEKTMDLPVQAWVLHQLGTREIGAGTRTQAVNWLRRALDMRESQGDKVGAAFTRHNLGLIAPPDESDEPKDGPPPKEPPIRRPLEGWVIPALIGAAAVIAILIYSLWPRPASNCPMPEGWQVYRVRGEETLDSISLRVAAALYGENEAEKKLAVVRLAILDANCLSLPTEVEKGQRVYVPVDPEERGVATAPTAARPTEAAASPLSLELAAETADGDTFHLPGQVIQYGYVIFNAGSEPLEGPITVKDDKVKDITCPEIGLLGPDERVSCTGTYNVTQADLDFGFITNTASALVGELESQQVSTTIRAVQNIELTFSKAASPTTYNQVGQTITYTYTILNSGNVTLSPVQFVVGDDHITGGEELFNCGPQTAELGPDVSVTCTASYSITQADVDARSVTNRAVLLARGLDRQLAINIPAATATINYAIPLTFTKAADPTTYDRAGQTITYTYTIVNINEISLPGPVILQDDRAAVTCPDVKTLAPNGTVTCTGTYVITQADVDSGSVTNRASGNLGGTELAQASATVRAVQHPDVAVSIEANPITYGSVDQAISYTYTITNTGNVTLDPIQFELRDDHINPAAPLPCNWDRKSLAPTETMTCSAAYNTTQSDADVGSVTSSATVSAVHNETIIASQPGTARITYICPPPPAGWVAYTVRRGDTLSEISSWYGDTTVLDLQRANCMGLSTDLIAGNRLYVPFLANVTGIVFADPNSNGRQDAGEPVLSGFMVPISSSTGRINDRTNTDANGRYLFTNLPPGTYTILYYPENLTSRETRRDFGLRPVP